MFCICLMSCNKYKKYIEKKFFLFFKTNYPYFPKQLKMSFLRLKNSIHFIYIQNTFRNHSSIFFCDLFATFFKKKKKKKENPVLSQHKKK